MDPSDLWRALSEEESVYLWIVNEDATIRYANEQAAHFYLAAPAKEVIGRRLEDLFPKTFTRQRLRLVRTLLESQTPVRFPTHWAGCWLHATAWPLHHPRRGVLVVIRHTFHRPAGDGTTPLSLGESDPQPLSALSPTARLVLAGIGEGWSTTEIARRMHRSSKTVEWHRQSIGRRLGCKTRVELARIALLAGLSWSQALAMCGGRYTEKADPPLAP